MGIYLGNLSVDEMERRSGVDFPQELKDYMGPRRQQSASNIKRGMWHCFDIPFVLVCGDMGTATEIHRHLKGLGSDFKEPLQISFSAPNAKLCGAEPQAKRPNERRRSE